MNVRPQIWISIVDVQCVVKTFLALTAKYSVTILPALVMEAATLKGNAIASNIFVALLATRAKVIGSKTIAARFV